MKMRIRFVLLFCTYTFASKNEERILTANKEFSASLLREIEYVTNGNYLFSPFSVQSILSLAYLGAKGETADELKSVLHLPTTDIKLKMGFEALKTYFKTSDSYTLEVNNKIYVKDNLSIGKHFERIAHKVFDTEIDNIDFTKAGKAASTVNSWIEKKTKEKIKGVLSVDDFYDTTGVFVNTVYLEAPWSKKFENFGKLPFYKSHNNKKMVEMMHLKSSFNYYEDKDSKFLQIPLAEDTSMTIVLPNDNNGLAGLADIYIFRVQFRETEVEVTLPKFKIESQFDFEEILQKLGVHNLFDKDKADLSGIAGRKGELLVNKIVQKAYINVNESGIEAAAATILESVKSKPTKISKQFIVDHPFIFYIKVKDLVIFAGKVADPQTK